MGKPSHVGGDGSAEPVAGQQGAAVGGAVVTGIADLPGAAGSPGISGAVGAGSRAETWEQSQGRPLRADARRNRDAVLAAAAEAFAHEGVDASLEEIARRAGVGVGTLYRHFPNREALVFGVYSREVELLAASATTLAAEMAPAEALREWMRRYVQYAATKRGLIGMLRTMMADNTEMFDRTKARIAAAAGALLAAAVASGEVRSDVQVEDVTRSMHGVCMAAAPETAGGSECAARMVDLVFDGLRYGAAAGR